jgi:C-terminal processing protease CtpA/Prc/N-acetylneuraminic acid mutarotase
VLGAWSSAARMLTLRASPTVTLLPDGTVLVTGGTNNLTAFATVERYNPATDTWTSAAPMVAARTNHTATLLDNGKVLVVGGYPGPVGDQPPLASAELYDPATNSWSIAGALATARHAHTATRLPSGKVLVVGGRGASGDRIDPLASAELYDPATNAWTSAGALALARTYYSATLLPSGKVLVAGGYQGGIYSTAAAELYDPATNTWTGTGAMATARDHFTATLLANGRVFVAGGSTGTRDPLASAELYDPSSGTWIKARDMATARGYHMATALPNGKVLLAGGYRGGFPVIGGAADTATALASAVLYDPLTNAWASAGDMAAARASFRATLLPSGKVLVVGGTLGRDTLATAELYDPNGRAAPSAPGQDPARYLADALDFLRENSVRRDRVDWEGLQREAAARARDASAAADTYPAIRYALGRLGDPSARLSEPELAAPAQPADRALGISFYSDRVITDVVPGGPAERAGVRTGDILEAVEGREVATPTEVRALVARSESVHLTLRRAGQASPLTVTVVPGAVGALYRKPEGERLAEGIGYVELPSTNCVGDACAGYAAAAQSAIRDLDRAPACGWIVDLRHDTVGSVFAMLAGIGPLLGEGDLGAFVYADGHRQVWSYREGQALNGNAVIVRVAEPYPLPTGLGEPPVAILTGRLTTGPGEDVALAFRGRPNARSFGEPTHGFPILTQTKALSDGATLTLTVAAGADRTGRTYDGPIAPDQLVQAGPSPTGAEGDPAVRAAADWLGGQGCASR